MRRVDASIILCRGADEGGEQPGACRRGTERRGQHTAAAATGGGASTAEGWLFALGGTEEHLRTVVFGTTERGRRADGPLNRLSGVGYVREHDGDYSDGLSKGLAVALYSTEVSGAVNHVLDTLLLSLNRTSHLPGAVDSTVYGLSPANAARGLRRHYLAAHSAAVTLADAQTLLDAAFTTGRELTRLDAAT